MNLSDIKEISSEVLLEIKNGVSNLTGNKILNTLLPRVAVSAIVSTGVYVLTKDANLTLNALAYSFGGSLLAKFAMKKEKKYMFGK